METTGKLIMPSKVKGMSKDVLEKMHTSSLLKRRNELLACETSFELSDRCGYEKPPDSKVIIFIEFKNTNAWQEAYVEVKNILSTRENLPSREERKQLRVERTKNGGKN